MSRFVEEIVPRLNGFERPTRPHRLIFESDEDGIPNWQKEMLDWMKAHPENGEAIVDGFIKHLREGVRSAIDEVEDARRDGRPLPESDVRFSAEPIRTGRYQDADAELCHEYVGIRCTCFPSVGYADPCASQPDPEVVKTGNETSGQPPERDDEKAAMEAFFFGGSGK